MSYISERVVSKLTLAFEPNKMLLEVKADCIVVQNSEKCKKQKIERIVEYAGFHPLIAKTKINKNFVFTVMPYKIPDCFDRAIKDPVELPQNPLQFSVNSTNKEKKPSNYVTKKEIVKLFKSYQFVPNDNHVVVNKWGSVNRFRVDVASALDQVLTGVVAKYAKTEHPIIEIGSGMGYLFGSLPVVRTQPNEDECTLLNMTNSEPVYKMNVQEIYNCLSTDGKKVPLFVAINVFDIMCPQLRKDSFFQLSLLQNVGDSIMIILDTNPHFYQTMIALKSHYPDDLILPYYPSYPSITPAKFSAIVVPKEHMTKEYSLEELLEMVNDEYEAILEGTTTKMQTKLRELQKTHDLTVISLEDFFVDQVKKELLEAGYAADGNYYNSFTCEDISERNHDVEKDLIYKPVTESVIVREWDITDPRMLEFLSEKGLTLPSHFDEEFIRSLRAKKQKILGAEILVVNAKKI